MRGKVKKFSLFAKAALALIFLIIVTPIIIYSYPVLIGADYSYTVMSGSMSPALNPGDLIIIKESSPSEIEVGDIITIEIEGRTFTHRVVERKEMGEGPKFITKGDANEEPDPALTEASQIIGRVVLVFPFGHLYTAYGFILALLAPAVVIIGKQMYTVHQFTKRRNKKETMRWRRKSHSALDTTTLLLALILTVNATRVIAPHFIVGSSGYFCDVERSTGFFGAGIWEIRASVDIDPDTLNLDSKGQWVTVYAVVETDYDENNIVIESVRLDGVIPAEWGEVNGTRLMVKFDRVSVIEYLIGKGYKDGDEVTLTVSGRFVDGVRFVGKDTIRVVKS